ncbi:MAG: hypothetical protein ACI8ZN_000029 [Bacteroidia bacterium]|jgi:hypothetical protein
MNTKRNVLIILGFLLAIGILFYIKNSYTRESSSGARVEFAVEHPEQVRQIFMTNKDGTKQVRLVKQDDGSWVLNNQYLAWQKKIDLLLTETMAKVKVKNPAPVTAVDNVITKMAIQGIKVEIYTSNLRMPSETFVVGGTTVDLMGTYFMHENEKPQVVHIPGFDGYLSSRFSLEEDDWISHTIFGSTPEEILAIHIDYPADSVGSFRIKNKDGIPDFTSRVTTPLINMAAVKSYLNFFEKLNYEGFEKSRSVVFLDSLKASQPYCIIRVISLNRGEEELKVYKKQTDDRTKSLYDKEGQELVEDTDRYYAVYSKLPKRLLFVQDYTFSKVFVRSSEFYLP